MKNCNFKKLTCLNIFQSYYYNHTEQTEMNYFDLSYHIKLTIKTSMRIKLNCKIFKFTKVLFDNLLYSFIIHTKAIFTKLFNILLIKEF